MFFAVICYVVGDDTDCTVQDVEVCEGKIFSVLWLIPNVVLTTASGGIVVGGPCHFVLLTLKYWNIIDFKNYLNNVKTELKLHLIDFISCILMSADEPKTVIFVGKLCSFSKCK